VFEFLCGDMSELRSRRTSAYEIGGEVYIISTSPTRTLPDRKSVSTAKSDTGSRSGNRRTVAPGPSTGSDMYTMPYGYGNPLVWMASNVIGRGLQELGLSPKSHPMEGTY